MSDPTAHERCWIFYDGRAEHGDEDDAAVLEACSTRRDLKDALFTWRRHDAVLFEYETHGKELVNGKRIGHVREGKSALLAKCWRRPEFKENPDAPDFSPNFHERNGIR